MILAFDISNTNITVGAFEQGKLTLKLTVASKTSKTADEYTVNLVELLKLYDYDKKEISGAIISSVVPSITPQIRIAAEKLSKKKALEVAPGIRSGVKLSIDDPSSLGADIVCGCVAAKKKYPLPCLIADLSTATKIYALDENGALIGASIASGIKISLEALYKNTAALPHINTDKKTKIIGTNTADAMRSGILHGTASMIDGMFERYEDEIGKKCTYILTGEYADEIAPFCHSQCILDEDLRLVGLNDIYELNTKKKVSI